MEFKAKKCMKTQNVTFLGVRGDVWDFFWVKKIGHNDLPEMTKDVLPLKWEAD